MCYKDRTWCSAADACATEPCSRRFTKEEEIRATIWWGNDNAPVMFGDFRDSCKDFVKKEKTYNEFSESQNK